MSRGSLTLGVALFLVFPVGCGEAPRGGPPAAPPVLGVYEVQPGDTLSGIAARFDVEGGVDGLARQNGIDDPDHVAAGDRLVVRAGPARRQSPDPLETRSPPSGALEPCAVRPLPPARPATLGGGERAHCAGDPASGLSACFCSGDGRGGDPPSWVEVRLDGERAARWAADAELGNTSALVAFLVDLGGSSAEELVVASRSATSNGMAVGSWTVAVVDPAAPAADPLRLTAEDFGPDSVVEVPSTGRCALLATEWLDAEDQRRGRGLYLVGRQLSWTPRGELVPAPGAELRCRRYLAAFESERMGHLVGDPLWRGAPRAWLDSAAAEACPEDPFLAGRRRSSVDVTVVEVSQGLRADGREGHLVLRLAGPRVATRHAYVERTAGDGEPPLAIGRLGHRPSGRLLPPGYRPAEARRSLVGRSGRLELRDDPPGNWPPRVLWLD